MGKKVFFIQGQQSCGSGVLIKNKRILTAAHLGFTLNNEYTVVGIDNSEFGAPLFHPR
jgi:V8-like Glu-specific endopeptidase